MLIRKLLAPFRRLRWKLTLSYTFVTVAVVVALEVLAFVALLLILNYSDLPQDLARQEVAAVADQVRPFLQEAPVDTRRLAEWLGAGMAPQVRGSAVLRISLWGPDEDAAIEVTPANSDVAVVLNAQGRGLAANFPNLLETHDAPFIDALSPAISQTLIAAAQAGDVAVWTLDDRTILVAHPVTGSGDEVLGVVYVRLVSLAPDIPGTTLRRGLQVLGTSALLFTAGTGVIGTLFGFLTAHGLTRRLHTLAAAAGAWGQGDFATVIRDPKPDEIGQLAVQLNRMAGQVQALLQTRAQLATLEERNRLARDLHDSVKQQVFAATMTLGAAQALWDRDPNLAREKVAEAFALGRKAQQDLTTLIQELRPADLDGQGLVAALREHVARWSQRTGIAATFELVPASETRHLPPEVEQALYRVGQEALTNVARHSRATHGGVTLTIDQAGVTLTVHDDGTGFDPARATGDRAAGSGLGLHSMHERTAALGGALTVESDEHGTTIRASVPL